MYFLPYEAGIPAHRHPWDHDAKQNYLLTTVYMRLFLYETVILKASSIPRWLPQSNHPTSGSPVDTKHQNTTPSSFGQRADQEGACLNHGRLQGCNPFHRLVRLRLVQRTRNSFLQPVSAPELNSSRPLAEGSREVEPTSNKKDRTNTGN